MTNHKFPRLALLTLATAGLTGCGKKEEPAAAKPEAVALVPVAARSKAFEATVSHLDVGGPVFAFVDTEGDPKRVADAFLNAAQMLAKMQPEMPAAMIPTTLDPFLADLGLDNIHATGFSSRHDGAAFVNRSFLYTPGGPGGVLGAFGSKNAAFVTPGMAPAGTLFAMEAELDGEKLLAVARAVAGHIGDGKDALAKLEAALKAPIPNAPFTGETLLKHLSGRVILGVSASKKEKIQLGTNAMPALDFALALEGRKALFDQFAPLAAMGGKNSPVVQTVEGDFTLLTVREKAPGPFARYAPVIALQQSTGRVWLATNRATLDAWTKPEGEKLAASADFKRVSAGLTTTGTGFAYVAPDAGETLHSIVDVGGKLAVAAMRNSNAQEAATIQSSLGAYDKAIDTLFPKVGGGYYCASAFAPDGIISESRAPISNKPNAYLWMTNSGAGVVVVGGLGAALAIPAFKKVRNNAIEKTMLNDARQVSSAANQYWSENAATSCKVSDIRAYLSGGSLSSGIRIGVITPANQHPAFADLLDFKSPEAGKLTIRTGGKIVLGNAEYDRTLSSNPRVTGSQQSGPKDTLVFEAETGVVVR